MPRLSVGLLLVLVTTGCASLNHRNNAVPGRNFIPVCASGQLIVRASNHGSTSADVFVGRNMVGTVSPGSTLLVPVQSTSWLRGAVRARPLHPDFLGKQLVGRSGSASGMVLSPQCP